MSKDTENNEVRILGRKPKEIKFRMAYSLNNWQPVQCTLVSDQPFFYMDEECVLDDDDTILGDEFLNEYDVLSDEVLMAEIKDIQKKMETYDRFSEQFSEKKENRLKEFLDDSENFIGKKMSQETSLQDVTDLLSKSRMGAELLDFASKNSIKVSYSLQTQTAIYDKAAQAIFIRSDLDIHEQVLLLAQELRRFWQEAKGALINPLSLQPDQAILINRAQKADLAVCLVRCAWEMKLQGAKEVWSRIENSSLYDLGRAFAREALSDFRTLNNGKASSAVFETWFLSERCRSEDKNLIQSMLADYRGYVFDSEDVSGQTAFEIICKLGEQPFGKNYLAPYAQMIANDSLFTEVRDRSNANFLWFIKFERKFVETEQELQSSSHIKMASIDSSDNKNMIEDTQNETGFSDSEPSLFHNEIPVQGDVGGDSNVIKVQFGHNR